MNGNHALAGMIAALAIATTPCAVNAAESSGAAAKAKSAESKLIERGRYMVITGHCNNCHSADVSYTQKQGDVPESEWLMGSGGLGWRGPWGTTYAANLRVNVDGMMETRWVEYMKNLRTRPPMPWWSVTATSRQDLRAMYRFIKQLGPVGRLPKQYLPPDQEPSPPYNILVTSVPTK